MTRLFWSIAAACNTETSDCITAKWFHIGDDVKLVNVTLLLLSLLFSGISLFSPSQQWTWPQKQNKVCILYLLCVIYILTNIWLSKFKLLNIVSLYQIFLSHVFTSLPATAPIMSTKLCAVRLLLVRDKRSQTNTTLLRCDIRLQKENTMQRDSVQHKCQLSDLPLIRWHLWQEGRKLLLCKTHTKKLLLRTDQEMLEGIK